MDPVKWSSLILDSFPILVPHTQELLVIQALILSMLMIVMVTTGWGVIIHDNLCDFKIGRPPYLPDLKKGAYLFGGWWGFRGLKMHPRVKLWGGQMTKFGLFELFNPYVL